MSTFDLTQLRDEDLGTALFDALVERLEAKVSKDPSIAVVRRMSTTFAVSRRGSLLTLSQGIGVQLLRGDLKSKDRRKSPRTFNVGRAAIRSRLAIKPDRIEGGPDEIIDWIVAKFLEWTAAKEDEQPAISEAIEARPLKPSPEAPKRPPAPPTAPQDPPTLPSARREARPASRVPQDRPAIREAVQGSESRPTATGSTVERRPAVRRTIRDGRPTQIERPVRTFQLLFKAARRELERTKTLPVGSTYVLLSAGVFVALTVEAFFNDLGSRVMPSWSQLQRLDPLEKAEILSIELFKEKVNWSVPPFQSVAAALGFKRALTEAQAATFPFDQVRRADPNETEIPRTRQAAWQEHCDAATIQRWIVDVRILLERFSRAHDPAGAPLE